MFEEIKREKRDQLKGVALSRSEAKALENYARKEELSLSIVIRRAIANELKTKGFL